MLVGGGGCLRGEIPEGELLGVGVGVTVLELTKTTHLFDDQSMQNVEHKAIEAGVHGQRLDDSSHEQSGQGGLLHQTLHDNGQHLLGVDATLAEAQVGRCNTTKPCSLFSCLPPLLDHQKGFILKP